MRRLLQQVRTVFRLLLDLDHGLDETIQLLPGLRLGRLDQQALRYQQRKIGRWGMVAIVEQTLGEVHGSDAQLLVLTLECHDEFVGCPASAVGDIKAGLCQPGHEVVRVECGEVGNAVHALATKHTCVDIGTHQHAGIAHEGRQATNALRPHVFRDPVVLIAVKPDDR